MGFDVLSGDELAVDCITVIHDDRGLRFRHNLPLSRKGVCLSGDGHWTVPVLLASVAFS